MPEYPGALEHFVPESFMFTSNACKVLVLHKTGGDATLDAVYTTFMQSGKSVHYGVDQAGVVWQFVPESMGSGGNCCVEAGYDPFWQPYLNEYGNLNLCTISIEHCDPSLDNSTALPSAQQEASFKLVAYLARKYHIPVSHIKGHNSIDPVSRARCPGNYPMNELLAYLASPQEEVPMEMSLDQPAIAAYFEAVPGNSQQWKCKQTGKIVQYSILAFYRSYGNAGYCGLTYLGLPVSNEIAIPGYQSCVKQYFERGVLAYDPNKQLSNPPGSGSVYPLSLYVGPGVDPLVSELQMKIDNLSKQLATPITPAVDPRLATMADKLEKINELAQEIVPLAKP